MSSSLCGARSMTARFTEFHASVKCTTLLIALPHDPGLDTAGRFRFESRQTLIVLTELVGKSESYVEHLVNALIGIPIGLAVLWVCGRIAKRGADCYLRDFREGRRADAVIWIRGRPLKFLRPKDLDFDDRR